jgi:hypothetical protein
MGIDLKEKALWMSADWNAVRWEVFVPQSVRNCGSVLTGPISTSSTEPAECSDKLSYRQLNSAALCN